ncbi:MAG: ABC transporter ATP-binding protein [Anaerolineae bacterium]
MYKNFRRLFVIYKGARRPLIVSQVMLLISVALNLAIVTLNGRLVNEGVQQGNIQVVISVAIWMIVLTLIQTVFAVANAGYAVLFAEGTGNYLRVASYRKVQSLTFGNLDRFRTSDLLVRLTSDVNNVKLAVLYGLMILLTAPFTVVLAVVIAFVIVPRQVWLMLVIMVIISIVLLLMLRGVQAMYDRRQKKLDGVNNVLQEDLAGVRVVKAFVRETYEMQRFAGAASALQDAALKPAYRMAMFAPTLMGLVYASIAVMFLVTGRGVLVIGDTNLGDVVVFSNLLVTAIVPIAMIAFILPYLEAGEASVGRIFEILDQTAEVQDTAGAKPVDMDHIEGRVVFENVTFGYRGPDGKPQGTALQNINLAVEPGETVGFLGATGSGKSSLVNLIPRFYDVVEGRVTIDGIDVRDIPQRQLRRIVGIALQEAVLFSGSVRGNILFGRPGADDDEMLAVAKAADADSFVSGIPQEYDAPVARRGANFSGGQRQRLSIARALALQPKVLILDDSTSALDIETEARVQEAVNGLMGKTTKFYVAQRISSVITADKIVLLDAGRQVAIGSHTELLKSNPLYRQIYESQLGKIEDTPAAPSAAAGSVQGGAQ